MKTIKHLLFSSVLLIYLTAHLAAQPYGLTNWVYTNTFGSGGFFSSPAIGANGTIYVAVQTPGTMLALNPTNHGALIWSFSALGQFKRIDSSPAIGSDGTIYFTDWGFDTETNSGPWYLYALNPTNGALIWKSSLSAQSQSSPAIGPDGKIYVGVGVTRHFDTNGGIVCFNPDGTTNWMTWTNGNGPYFVVTSPAIGKDGTIYAGEETINGDSPPPAKFHAINPDGTEKWVLTPTSNTTSRESKSLFGGSPGIGPDGTIYCARWDDSIYAFKDQGTNGIEKWRFDTIGATSGLVESSRGNISVGVDGTIYFGTDDSHVYALKDLGTNSATLWVSPVGGECEYTGPALAANGIIYVGGGSGGLYAFNPDGTTNWYCPVGEVYGSPAIGADGSIYIGASEDPHFYSLCGPDTNANKQLVNGPWPKFGRDQFHSSRDYNQNLSAGLLTNGNFQFQVTGPSNSPTAAVLASTDLANWVTVTNIDANGQPITITDTNAGSYAYRFYATKGARAWSINALGYIQVTAPPGYCMIANQLDAGTNTVGVLFPSSTTFPGSDIFKWNYTDQAFIGDFFDSFDLVWSDPSVTLAPGEAGMWYSPASTNVTLTFIGQLEQGWLNNFLNSNNVGVSSMVPIAGFPGAQLGFPGFSGDWIDKMTNTSGVLGEYPFPWTNAPTMSVGESFISHKTNATNWTIFFSATPPP